MHSNAKSLHSTKWAIKVNLVFFLNRFESIYFCDLKLKTHSMVFLYIEELISDIVSIFVEKTVKNSINIKHSDCSKMIKHKIYD